MRVDEGRVVYILGAEYHGRLWATDPNNLTNPSVPGVGEEPEMGDSDVLLDVCRLPYLLRLGRHIVPHRAVLYHFTIYGVYGLPSSISGC